MGEAKLIDFWNRLQQVKTLEGLNRKGLVKVEMRSETQILFHEHGINEGHPFTNIYQWDWAESSIGLSHRRYCPTFLYSLELQNGLLISHTPHLCGEDAYRAKLSIEEEGLLLSTQIRGPNKNIDLWVKYD